MLIKLKSRKGFTLIELLVVISIISLLSSVVLSSLGTARARARDAKRMQDLAQINTAIQLYILDNGEAPDTGGAGVIRSTDSSWESYLEPQLTPYISSLPVDPCPSCDPHAGRNGEGGIAEPSATQGSQEFRYIYGRDDYWHGDCERGGGNCSLEGYVLDLSGFETRPKTNMILYNFSNLY